MKDNTEEIAEKKGIPLNRYFTEENIQENKNLQIFYKIQNQKNIRSRSSAIEKERFTIKILNSINAFLSLIVILLSLIEYEMHYYPSFFKDRDLLNEGQKLFFKFFESIFFIH